MGARVEAWVGAWVVDRVEAWVGGLGWSRPSETALLLLHRCIYNRSGEWRDETLPILLSSAVAFSYVTFLLVTVHTLMCTPSRARPHRCRGAHCSACF